MALTACIEPAASGIDVGTVAKLAANSLSPGALASGQLTTAVLDATSAAEMGPTSDARKVLAFAAGCALDPSQTVSFTMAGTTYVLTGAIGIAPGWVTSGLSATEAAWVSACVFSRVNLTSTLVTISARGDNAAYDTTIGEVDAYQVEEGAFWGNAFLDLGSLAAYSCNGVDQAADDTYGDLPLRECAEWDGVTSSNLSPCSMHYAGLCSDACATATAPYSDCAFGGGTAAAAVVTTFLNGTPE